jgi:ribosomal peptide maturation radical SAM protein 1
MPFVSIETPSIQLGLLKALATRAGFPVTNLHLSLDFACQIGTARYGILANHRGRLYGDWLFAKAALAERAPRKGDDFLRDYAKEINSALSDLGDCPVETIRSIRDREVPRYLDRLVEAIPWARFRIVGFTSTFQQNMASFALAARLKKHHPHLVTVFGGANFDGEMGSELVRTIDCIDYAISGAGDEAFLDFLVALLDERDPATVPGVLRRGRESAHGGEPREPFRNLDQLPPPEYEDFFDRAEALGLLDRASRGNVRLPFESSRGCWWGQKQHCTFCGLNGETMGYRAKSPDRVIQELAELAKRHRTFRFEAVDNILPMPYLQELLPKLVESGTTYSLFYETKANLKREHLALLAEAGVITIQPGIESLSSHVLELMRKGVTAIQNVNLLRWAAYYDIYVVWNLIWGFPGERVEDCLAQAELIPHLAHLQPPLSASRIWMERFSPIFVDRARFPVRRLEPEASYTYVYPDFVDRKRVAYFFDYEFDDALPDAAYDLVAELAGSWKQAWTRPSRPALRFRASPGFVQVDDRRACNSAATYTLTGPLAALYSSCSDSPRSVTTLKNRSVVDWSEGKIETALGKLCSQGLMMRDGDLYLSLAIPARVAGGRAST